MTTFGDKIRKLRKEKKMTQQKLGAMVGVSYRTIRAWEIDGRYPKQSSLYQKLADAFQCQVSYLMNDNETVCLEKKNRTYNSVNDPEIFTLEIELLVPVVRV